MTLKDTLLRRGVKFHTHRSKPNEIFLCCPFCILRGESPDTRFRLSVNTAKGIGHCYNCNYKSRAITHHLLRSLNIPVDGVTADDIVKGLTQPDPLTLPDGFHPLKLSLDSLEREAWDYLLTERKITKEQIRGNRIGVTFLGRYAYRIVFPVYEEKQLHGFVTRALRKSMKPRYLNSTGEKSLYNLAGARTTTILVEGIFKALRIERMLQQANVDVGVCALLGHDITDLQIEQLKKQNVKEAVLWPDPDRVGGWGMMQVADKLMEAKVDLQIVSCKKPADEVALPVLRESWESRQPWIDDSEYGNNMKFLSTIRLLGPC